MPNEFLRTRARFPLCLEWRWTVVPPPVEELLLLVNKNQDGGQRGVRLTPESRGTPRGFDGSIRVLLGTEKDASRSTNGNPGRWTEREEATMSRIGSRRAELEPHRHYRATKHTSCIIQRCSFVFYLTPPSDYSPTLFYTLNELLLWHSGHEDSGLNTNPHNRHTRSHLHTQHYPKDFP